MCCACVLGSFDTFRNELSRLLYSFESHAFVPQQFFFAILAAQKAEFIKGNLRQGLLDFLRNISWARLSRRAGDNNRRNE